MIARTDQPKFTNLLEILFTTQHGQLIVNLPPSECVKRLLTLSGSRRTVKVTAMDDKKGYDFKIEIRRTAKATEYTSAKCTGFVVTKDEPGKSFVFYEYQVSLYQRFHMVFLVFSFITILFGVIKLSDSSSAVLAVAVVFLGAYSSIREVKEDYKINDVVKDMLQTSGTVNTI